MPTLIELKRELYCEIANKRISQQIVTEGVSHSNTMGTHANRPADTPQDLIVNGGSVVSNSKGCGKDLYYEFYTEDDFKENKTGIIGKCGDLKQFPNKEWKERMYCKECKKAVEK
jgi:hypothetical protein